MIERGPNPPGVGVMLPISSVMSDDAFDIAAAARHAEGLGFTSVWVGDHLAFHVPLVDSTVALAVAAGATSTIRLGVGVMLVALRHPAWIAKQLNTLQVLSGNRLELGVGVGGEYAEEWRVAGVPREERAHRTDAFLDAAPKLLAAQDVSVGSPYDVGIPPIQPAGAVPPVWVGGRSDAATERAARFADGWLGLWASPSRVRRTRNRLGERAAAHGRATPGLGMLVFCNVDDDSARARGETDALLRAQYRLRLDQVERYTALGTIEQVAASLRELVDAGVTTLVLAPASKEWRRQYDRLAEVRELLKTSA